MATGNNENNDKIYGILRDLGNGAITTEDAFAKIKGLTDATELDEKSFSDDQKTELVETTDEQEGDGIDRPDVAVQVVQNPEVDDTEKAQEEAEVEEKPTKSRRKKKTTEDDETNTTTTDK